MNETKKDNKKEEKIVRIDIRKMPTRKAIGVPSIVMTVILTLLLTAGIYLFRTINFKGEEVSVSQIVTDISNGEYDKIILKDDMVLLEKNSKTDTGLEVVNRKYALLPMDTDFYQILSNAQINVKDLENDFYEPKIGITLGDILTFLFLGAALILVYVMVKNMQSSGGKILDFGESKARLLMGKRTGVTFEDVAGIDEVKEELTEIIDFLKNPKKYSNIGARIPRGVLLTGDPGTGKTLLAKAVAGEAGVPFFHTSGSEFEEMLVGAGASRFRTETTFRLLKEVRLDVIRGNISEIKTVYSGSGSTKGVDANIEDAVTDENIDEVILFAKKLSEKLNSVIAITGAVDIVSNSKKAYIIKNGNPMMSKVTGTGCMLSSLIGAYCAANNDNFLDATAVAVCAMGLCGELAYGKVIQGDGGTSSFRMHLIDFMSKIDGNILKGGAKIEGR